MWTEYITPETINGRIWPMAATVAERLWSPASATDTDSMYAHLPILSQFLAYRGLDYASARDAALQRMVGTADVMPLKVLANVVEPPKGYPRGSNREYDAYTPLNHLSDVVAPEADRARQFRVLANRIASGAATPDDLRLARKWLTLWRDNDAALQPLLAQSALTTELAPLSRNLSQSAQIGLDVLDFLEKKKPVKANVKDQDLTTLKTLSKPTAELTNMMIPGVETLLLATKP